MRKLLLVLPMLLAALAAHADAVWTNGWDFTSGTVTNLGGDTGATITLGGGTLSSAGYTFQAGQGITISNAIPPGEYSVHMVFSFQPISDLPSQYGWAELIDFVSGGLWIYQDNLNFYPWTGNIAGGQLQPDTIYSVIVTHVDGLQFGGSLIYLDGSLLASTWSVATDSVPTLRFFLDPSMIQNTGGTIQRIDIYSGTMSQPQATQVDISGDPTLSQPIHTPEPSALALVGYGLATLSLLLRRAR